MRYRVALLLLLTGPGWAARLVSVGTSVTETLCGLGVCSEVVGVDTSSKSYIPEVAKVPAVGAFRSISAEGIVSLKPTQVFLAFDAGPPEAIKQLTDAGVKVTVVPRNYTLDEVKSAVRFIAGDLKLTTRGEEVVRSVDSAMRQVADLQKRMTEHPRVLFCALGPNAPTGSLSGSKTRIDEMIKLSGGVNAVTSFEGSRPMTEEGVIAASPDVILMTERGFERAGGVEGVRKLPGISLTKAGKNRRIVSVSDIYFQGFGPGIGKAVLLLTRSLHPELQ